MLKNNLIAALVIFGALNLAGGESIAEECKRLNGECPPYERVGAETCHQCISSSDSKSCTREKDPGVCGAGYYFTITEVQQALKKNNYNVDLTGKFDDRTRKAIESFQKQLNIKKDGKGVVGPETLGKLMQQRAP